ncbi:phage tail tape measure protein [Aedoeadaptatus acetigenes]|uniref:Phage tail tape measure protein n=1 Tax=Aedoeadaptatus acetigenes TaxID=2981723 RepID=A0ABV1J3H2_9FIRM
MADARELVFSIKVESADDSVEKIKEVDKAMDGAKSKVGGLGGAMQTLGSGMKLAGGKIQSFGGAVMGKGKDITKFGKKVTRATAPFAAVAAVGVKKFMELDTAIRQVSTLTTDEVLPVSQIRKDVKAISNAHGIAQTEVAGAMYEALSSGIDQSKVTEFTKSAVKLTKAGFTDMATVVDATTTVLNAYGDAAYDVSKIHDIFVKTQDKGKITVDDLGKNIGRVIPLAAAAGVNVDQLGASYAMLTAKGQNAQIATTNLNSMIAELSSSGTRADKVLRGATGKSFSELTKSGTSLGDVLGILNENATKSGMALNDMFGNTSAGQAAMSLFSEGAEGYNKMLKEMQNSDGATDANYEKMIGPAEQWAQAKSQIENSLIDLGGAMAPFVVEIAGAISEVVAKFQELDPATQSTIAQWALLVLAAGPLISIFGSIVTGVGMFISVIGGVIGFVGSLVGVLGTVISAIGSFVAALGPIGWAIMAVVGVGAFLISNWQEIKAEAASLGGGIRGYLVGALHVAGSKFSGLRSKATGALNAIKGAWESLKRALANPIKGVVSIVSSAAGGIAKLGGGGGKGKGKGKKGVPSHATGLDYVPHDDYLANLHEGEIILTKSAANAYRELGGTKDGITEVNTTRTETVNRNRTNSETVNNTSPNVTINVYGGENNPMAIAREVRKEFSNLFRDLRLQRV